MEMSENYFALVRREPMIVGFWRQNDPSGNNDAIDYASRYGLTGVYTNRTLGPALTQNDLSAASSVLSSGSMVVGDIAPLRITGDMSIECWIVPYAASQTCALVSKYDAGDTHPNPYFLGLSSGQVSYTLGNGTTAVGVSGIPLPPVSVPSHIVATSFRGVMTVYINGVIGGTATLGSQAVTDGGQPMYVGELRTGVYNFNGLISEVAIYNGALSARRVTRHFTIGQQVLSDPAHYWTVDPPVSP